MDIILNRILDLISQKGITDKQFLIDNKFSLSLMSDWKSGRNKSYKKHIDKIADYFDVSTDYLLGLTDNKREPNVTVEYSNGSTMALDDETLEYIDSLRKRPEMKMLFSVTSKATKEDIIKAVKIIEALKGESE